jgi:hypothetical protein
VRIFELVGTAWTFSGEILGQAVNDKIGASVAISGSGHRVIAGMQSSNPTGTTGYARVYENQSGTWNLVGQLNDLDGSVTGSEHGYAVDMDATGDRVVVTTPGLNGESGGFSIYDYNSASTPPQWDRNFFLDEGTTLTGHFGHSVSMSPDGLKVLVGAPKYQAGSYLGYFRAYSFVSLNSWGALHVAAGVDGANSYCGVTVAITNGERIVLGVPGASDGTGTLTGKVRRITNTYISQ